MSFKTAAPKGSNLPVQRSVRDPRLEPAPSVTAPESPRATIQQKIKALQTEANSQMSVILQTSQINRDNNCDISNSDNLKCQEFLQNKKKYLSDVEIADLLNILS